MATTTKREYRLSPFGEAVHPWLNRPDTKFNELGIYKVGVKLSGPEALAFAEGIRAASDRHLEEVTAEMTPGERKKWSVYYPFEELEDDNGDKTGEIVFDFKQNATLRLKSGEEKKITLRLQNGAGKDSAKAIFSGSTLRTLYALRDIKMVSSKQAGVRLDFAGAQVTVYGNGSSGGGFGAVDGWKDDGSAEDEGGFSSQASGSDPQPDASGDY